MYELDLQKTQCQHCSFGTFCLNNETTEFAQKNKLLKKGEILHSANDKFRNLYAIKSGALKTYETDLMGNELIHGLYLKNEIYGYDAIYSGRYFFSAKALSDTLICEISYSEFLESLRCKPNFLPRILNLMSQQLTLGAYLKLVTAQQRVAAFLLDIYTRLFIEKSNSSFLLPMTYQDMGNYLGLATETISRTLSQFKKEKLIGIENKMIYFFELDEIKDIAEGFSF